MPRLLLVDGHSNLYRAFYAIRTPLSAPDGTPTAAAYGFLRMQHRLLRELAPSHVAVAFDAGRETFRTRLDKRYKAQRAPMPEALRAQVPLTQEALGLLGITVFSREDFEADDLIGTLAAAAAGAGLEVVIASADKDLMQLVRDPAVKMWHTRAERLLDEAGVAELFGVAPGQVVELLALMGDASDNIPGCPGIGEKGAKELIRQWGSVAAIYANLERVTPARAQRLLAEHRGEVELAHQLARIRTDLTLDLALDSLARRAPEAEGLAAFYRRMGFSSLLAELETPVARAAAVEVGYTAAAEVSLDELAALLGATTEPAVALAGSLLAVSSRGAVSRVAGTPAELAAVVAPHAGRAWCHDAKALLSALRDAGCEPAGVPRDTMLAGYLLAPGEPTDLAALCRRLGVAPPSV
ncbi:MAG: 5'-3' exonuclease H3TH domain-containing protein, partial [Acidobacteriota bacterium]